MFKLLQYAKDSLLGIPDLNVAGGVVKNQRRIGEGLHSHVFVGDWNQNNNITQVAV